MANTAHINPGLLNKRVLIQKPVDVPDGMGGMQRSWATVFNTWAEVVETGGSEPYEHMQNYPKQSYQITIRYRKGIHMDMRIIYRKKILNIRSLRDEGEEQVLAVMQCEELSAKGTI